MKISEIKTMLAETNLSATYLQWPEKQVPDLPYIVWTLPSSNNFGADDKVYKRIETLEVELYSNPRDFATEAAVEAVLESHELFWDKTSFWLSTENMNETVYTIEIFIEAETANS